MNGLFGVNGLLGFFVAVVLLLSVVAFLGTCAILTQKDVATHYYKIEHIDAIQFKNTGNAEHHVSAE